jgi:hypothetical protein
MGKRGGWGMRGVPLETRFAAKYEKNPETGCWDWTASRFTNGYGCFRLAGETRGAHRVAYEIYVGEIPEGLTIDHLCRNVLCVNPAHLEAVTMRENTLRGFNPGALNARKTECIRGHAFDNANTIVRLTPRGTLRRECRICLRASQRKYGRRIRLEAHAKEQA